jgi:hypothetical protein
MVSFAGVSVATFFVTSFFAAFSTAGFFVSAFSTAGFFIAADAFIAGFFIAADAFIDGFFVAAFIATQQRHAKAPYHTNRKLKSRNLI